MKHPMATGLEPDYLTRAEHLAHLFLKAADDPHPPADPIEFLLENAPSCGMPLREQRRLFQDLTGRVTRTANHPLACWRSVPAAVKQQILQPSGLLEEAMADSPLRWTMRAMVSYVRQEISQALEAQTEEMLAKWEATGVIQAEPHQEP